ncbi:MAG: Fic family protein [Gammaproteobacteria bacterium]|nr:Fic family protein [Gammaproteobacteria bacterium]MYD80902.1 Fic family protein [Gammaproteobacteria bacterium]
MDWDRFSFEFRLNKSFSDVLISIEGYRRAVERIYIPSAWKTELNRLNRIRAIHGTTAIEGNLMSEDQVRDFLERSSTDRDSEVPRSADQLQVQNAERAQEWIRARISTPRDVGLTLENLLYLHKLITEGEHSADNVSGRLRSRSVVVGSKDLGGVHVGAPHDRLHDLLREFFDWLYSRETRERWHSVVRAFLAHFFLVTIHPFGDGNGRLSRLIEAYLLFVGGYNIHGFYGLSNFFYQNADDYRTLLQRSRRSHPFDLTEFIEFGLRGFENELEGINSFIQVRQNRMMYMETLKRSHSTKKSARRYVLSNREYRFLMHLVDETNPIDPFGNRVEKRMPLVEIRSNPFIQLIYNEVSTRTFMRDIEQLREKGFVKLTPNDDNDPCISIDLSAIERY